MQAAPTDTHEQLAVIAAIARADYARAMRAAIAAARDTIALHTGRTLSPAELDEFLRGGYLPADIQVRP